MVRKRACATETMNLCVLSVLCGKKESHKDPLVINHPLQQHHEQHRSQQPRPERPIDRPDLVDGGHLVADELLKTQHPLMAQGFTHQWITPKYRHSVHTLVADLDILAVWWGPYGDMYRHDKRMPWVAEGFVDINPTDAKELGIGDGDYIWVDADPEDRPFHGWQERPAEAKIARVMLRARYYPGTPRGIARTFFHFPGASFGSVRGHETRDDGQAKSPTTGYQAMYRYGSHQSGTRSWLRPTLLTDSLVRKELMGQMIGQGFCPDVHCANGAPREAFVKFTKAEAGGKDGKSPWEPIALGIRPGQESDAMKIYLQGKFIKDKRS